MHKLSAIQLRDRFLEGSVSAVEIVEYFLKRIEKFDPEIGAFLCVMKERSLEKAKKLDEKLKKGLPLGKLAAIPIGIKDNIHVKGVPTTCASKFMENYIATFDATVCRLLEDEDAILIGKLNLDEFAMGSSNENSAFYPVKNPWNTKCVPGGSSGGSAAAVAARLCPITLGTDTGGSIRQPAAFCGVVGFKPTFGRVSRYGLVAFGSSLDQIGPITTHTEDAALIMEVIGAHCDFDSTSLPEDKAEYLPALTKSLKGKTIGVPWHFLENLGPKILDNFKAAVKLLKELGCIIQEVDLDVLQYSIAVYYVLSTAEASTNLAKFDGIRFGKRSEKATTLDEVYRFSRSEGFGAEVKRRILLGNYLLSAGQQDAFYKKAQKVRTQVIEHYAKAFTLCDAICMPTSPIAAFEMGALQDPLQMYLQDIYTISMSLAGLPTSAVPSGFLDNGKPLGIQFITPQKRDVDALNFAYQFENAARYHKKMPAQFDEELL